MCVSLFSVDVYAFFSYYGDVYITVEHIVFLETCILLGEGVRGRVYSFCGGVYFLCRHQYSFFILFCHCSHIYRREALRLL